jgi:hypothetical protein
LKIKISGRRMVYFKPKRHMYFDDCDEKAIDGYGESQNNHIMDFIFANQTLEQVAYSSVSLTESNSHLRRQYTAFHKQAHSTPR